MTDIFVKTYLKVRVKSLGQHAILSMIELSTLQNYPLLIVLLNLNAKIVAIHTVQFGFKDLLGVRKLKFCNTEVLQGGLVD